MEKEKHEEIEVANNFAKFKTAVDNSIHYIQMYRRIDPMLHKEVVDLYADLFGKSGNFRNNDIIGFYIIAAHMLAANYSHFTGLGIINDRAITIYLSELLKASLDNDK